MLKRKTRFALILILVSLITYNVNYLTYKKNIKTTEEKIEKEIVNNLKKPILKKEENLSDDYLGYIEIPKYKIKNLIKNGTKNNILNQNIVGKYQNNTNINSKRGQLILAGHNNKYVFKNLSKVQINDEIIIRTKEKTYKYQVKQIKKINKSDTSHFNINNNKKELVLITCLSNDKRLLIFANPK